MVGDRIDAHKGFLVCRVCQMLTHPDRGMRSCISGGVHDVMTSRPYKAPWRGLGEGVQAGWSICEKCSGLAWDTAPGVCDSGAHEFAEHREHYGVPTVAFAGTQPGWQWCGRCQSLWNANHPEGQCRAGGAHDPSGSSQYHVPVVEAGLEDWWLWCRQCQGLVHDGERGICVDKGFHGGATATSYQVAFGSSPSGNRAGWRMCSRCTMLVFGETSGGVCFGDGPHEFAESLSYTIPMDIEPTDAQPGWRVCVKCQCLSYSGFVVGPCPAGGEHDHSGSAKYSIYPIQAFEQPGWRLCNKCRSLTCAAVSAGICRDGGDHDHSGSVNYAAYDQWFLEGGEGSWNRCCRCQVLSHGGPGFDGVCFDGLPHDFTESISYCVYTTQPAPSGQTGWRACAVCKQLVLPPADGSGGLCANGVPHDLTGSAEYSVTVHKPFTPEPSEVAALGLTVTESQAAVVVDGKGFTAGAAVELSFVVRAKTTKVTVVADDAGSFNHQQAPAIAAPASGGYVLAFESPAKNTSARMRTWVPAPPA